MKIITISFNFMQKNDKIHDMIVNERETDEQYEASEHTPRNTRDTHVHPFAQINNITTIN